MERISTKFLLHEEEVEGLVHHLRERGFDVRRNKDDAKEREYHISQKIGGPPYFLQSVGSIKGHFLDVGYQADRLLETAVHYQSQIASVLSSQPART